VWFNFPDCHYATSAICIVVGCVLNMAYLAWKNKQRSNPAYREKILEKYVGDGKDDEKDALETWVELGDRHPDFKYTL